MATPFVPAEVFPPGVIIRQELEARGWTQADLAEIMERPVQAVSEIIRAKKRVTEETAKELEAALGIEAEFWTRTEALYRLHRSEPAPSAIKRRAALRARVPLRLMIARGWIEGSDDVSELEARVMHYQGVSRLEESSAFPMAAKQTLYSEPLTPTQSVWLLRVKQLAETMTTTPAYSREKLLKAIEELKGLLRDPQEARRVPRILADAGVRLLVVERLPGLKIDGVCFWLNAGTQPVIGLSLIHDRIDNFWFVVRHEIEHVLNGDGKDGAIVDNELDIAASQSEQETRANLAAAEFCVPQAAFNDFVLRKSPLFTDENIRLFAQDQNRHPGLVAGQLRRRFAAWTKFTAHLDRVRHFVVGTALVDGFGSSPSITR